MPEQMHDTVEEIKLGEGNKVTKPVEGPVLNISSKILPELKDFNLNDRVEMKISAKVIEISQPELKEGISKTDELSVYKLEIIVAGISNVSKERKEANERNLSKEDWSEIKSKRKPVES